jgi:SpoVK/Ycf46/Vps4 family AAA+-type ATPase
MTAHEFENAVSRALITLRNDLPNVSIDAFCDVVLGLKTEVVKRSEVLEVMPTDNIANIGGLENLKLWIRKRARCFSQEARDYGVETPKGIALIGPPGTGKTAASKAIGSVLGLPLVRFDVGRIFNSLVGESESRVRAALKMVEALAPCVLMIDEADKAFAGQARGGGGGDSGVGMRVLGALLTWMQETKSPVFMVVTANRTQNLPSEFLRRGRLDEVFSVTVPHEGERLEVLRIHLRKRGHNPEGVDNLAAAAERSAGYVSAEIEAAVKDALIEAFTNDVPLTGDLIAAQFGNMVPLSEAFKEDFETMQQWAEQNARPASLATGQTQEAPRTRVRARPAIAAAGANGGRTLSGLDG